MAVDSSETLDTSSSTSFTSLLVSDHHHPTISAAVTKGLGDRTASGVPKFKSLPPPSLPISPLPSVVSPSYFAIPRGLSAADFLDSPVLLSASNILPSPTTGTFPILGFDWKSNSDRNQQEEIQNEQKTISDFSFKTQTNPLTSYGQHNWGYQESANQDFVSSDKANLLSEFSSNQRFSPEINATIQTNIPSNNVVRSEYNQYNQISQTIREKTTSDDGYNWRKYGQKQVKGSSNPRSYYKCTYPNCPIRKKVERSLDGEISEIVYRGNHNHPKPQSSRRSSSSSSSASATSVVIQTSSTQSYEIPEQSYGSADDVEESSEKSESGRVEFNDDELNAKRWKSEAENEVISALERRTVREPRVVVQTISDMDILDDGYRWRKYGQKVVKGNPNPRSYYKCTSPGCNVRKHVERASHDNRAVITTYEGKHNHDVPARRGNGNNITAVRPSILSHNSTYPMPIHSSARPPASDNGSYGY